MDKKTSRRVSTDVLAAIILLITIAVLLSWPLNLPLIRSVRPDWTPMQLVTAFCFLLVGIKVYYIQEYERGRLQPAQIILSSASLVLLLLMATYLVSLAFHISTGIEELFASPSNPSAQGPSVFTAICFLLIVCVSILTKLRSPQLRTQQTIIGGFLIAIGGLAVIGYLLSVPAFYYSFPSLGHPMAFMSACLFTLAGIALLCVEVHDEVAS